MITTDSRFEGQLCPKSGGHHSRLRGCYVRNQVVTTNATTVVMLAVTAKALLPENTTHAWFSLLCVFRCYSQKKKERQKAQSTNGLQSDNIKSIYQTIEISGLTHTHTHTHTHTCTHARTHTHTPTHTHTHTHTHTYIHSHIPTWEQNSPLEHSFTTRYMLNNTAGNTSNDSHLQTKRSHSIYSEAPCITHVGYFLLGNHPRWLKHPVYLVLDNYLWTSTHGGLPGSQKSGSPLPRIIESYRKFSRCQPGVKQSIALNASTTARESVFLVQIRSRHQETWDLNSDPICDLMTCVWD